MRSTRIFLTLGMLVLLGLGVAGGIGYERYRTAATTDSIVHTVTNTDGSTSRSVDFGLFWQVWDRLNAKYVDHSTLDATTLVYGAISGMVNAAGDPYTVFMPPVDAQKFQEDVSGAFSGVGMEIGKRDGNLIVIAPINNTPAMRAGIHAGDFIIKVDDIETSAWTVEEAVAHIRGPKGTTVHLTLARDGSPELLEFTVVRDTIRIPAIAWKLLDDNRTAYLQIFTFNGNVDDEFAKAAREIGASGATRVIVDLRNNPGGLLDSAVNIAGAFVPADSIAVQEKYSDGTIDTLRTSGTPRFGNMPVIVLINGGSASASEILAGALHDIRGITLVGEQTFGKGSVQQVESFYNGSSLKVTIAHWLTPNGVNISKTGIAPDEKVIMDPENPDAKSWVVGTPGKDPQLDKALAIISKL